MPGVFNGRKMFQIIQIPLYKWKTFIKLWLSTVAIHLLYYKYVSNEANLQQHEHQMRISQNIDEFQENWCRIHRARVDLNSLLKPCNYNISWNGESPNRKLRTDADQSFISLFDIRAAGQFSRFGIQTKTQNGELKLLGGDSWRVLLRGPATVSPTVFDHGNGTYEVLFLVMDPGVYKLDITLDYSLCDGYRNPPKNWFIVGNSQGKMQKDDTLGVNRARDDYLLQPFQEGKLIMINVPMPTNGGAYLMNRLLDRSCLASKFDLSCGIKCNFMWDGFGRWLGKNWKPYLTEIPSHLPPKKSKIKAPKLETLWIYGDSQAERLHMSIQDTPLCTKIFKSCKLSKMWVYPYTSQSPPWDNNDYDDKIIIDDLRAVLERLDMKDNSVLILNLGLHYMESVSLRDYQRLLEKVVALLNEKESETGELRHKARVIWKTSTSLSKEKDTGSQLKSDRRRFLTLPRVRLYNTFATSLMCRAGLEVLDVYPFTRSYPGGTGGPEVAYYKERDIVHFKFHVMKSLDLFTEDYFLGNVVFPIDLKNYMFS